MLRFFFFFLVRLFFFFFSSHFIRNFIISGRHNQYKRSNIEHRKLVCVLLNASCWQIYVGRDVGEVCVRRPRSRCGTYKASVNIVHIRCQWKLRDIRLERRVPYKESRNIGGERERERTLGSCFVQSSSCFKPRSLDPPSRDRRIHYIYIICSIYYSKITATLLYYHNLYKFRIAVKRDIIKRFFSNGHPSQYRSRPM